MIDDLVRANNVCNILKEEKAYLYPDVKFLCNLYLAKATLDFGDVERELDYIKLLLEETDKPLLIRTRPQQEQLNVLDRITDLI